MDQWGFFIFQRCVDCLVDDQTILGATEARREGVVACRHSVVRGYNRARLLEELEPEAFMESME
jgi:hypothetical protein